MYPETDVPPVRIDSERLDLLRAQLPELPSATRARLVDRYGLSPETASWILRNDEVDRFETLVSEGHAPTLVARLLSQDLPNAFASATNSVPDDVPLTTLHELLTGIGRGEYSKEALPRILGEFAKGATSVAEAARRAGAEGMSREELERIANEVVASNQPLIDARGEAAFQPLMGDVMRRVRGRRDGQEVATVVRKALADRMAAPDSAT
jgi:glutamyl-tRNA(Gln) amidotransferase subunit E